MLTVILVLFPLEGHRLKKVSTHYFSFDKYLSYFDGTTLERTYNDKAYTSPHLFGQFFNFRISIKFFIHEVKKTSKF